MSWLALAGIKRALGALPAWLYVAAVLGLAFLFYALHLIGQRNDARDSLATANARIEELVRDNATLKGNNGRLEAAVATQNELLESMGQDAARRQSQVAQALAAADVKASEQAARIKSLKAIQEAGDRSKGANYAFEARRANR